MAGTSKVDNIIIGIPLVNPKKLGIEDDERTTTFSFADIQNDKGEIFLPAVLRKVGIFKSTSEVKNVNKQRTELIAKDSNHDLWRNLGNPEFTEFKIGKKIFTLIVGANVETIKDLENLGENDEW